MFFQEELLALVKLSNLKEFLVKQTIRNVNEHKIPLYMLQREYIVQCDILLKPNLQKKKKKKALC